MLRISDKKSILPKYHISKRCICDDKRDFLRKKISSHFRSKTNQDLLITKCVIFKKGNKGNIELISYKKLR